MECDKQALVFSDALYTYLWLTEYRVSENTETNIVGNGSDFIAKVAEAVSVLSVLASPTFNENMKEYFKENGMSRRYVFTFLTSYCFNYHAENPDIFAVALNNCSFIHRLVIFCKRRGHAEYIKFAAMCWAEIFKMDLKGEFYAKGGWEEFRKYVASKCYYSICGDTNLTMFVKLLDDMNILFPKFETAEPEDLQNSFTAETSVFAQPEVGNSSECITTSSLEMLRSSEFCQNRDFNSASTFRIGDKSVGENCVLNKTITESSDNVKEKTLIPSYVLEDVISDLKRCHIYNDCKDSDCNRSRVVQPKEQPSPKGGFKPKKDKINPPSLPVETLDYDDKEDSDYRICVPEPMPLLSLDRYSQQKKYKEGFSTLPIEPKDYDDKKESDYERSRLSLQDCDLKLEFKEIDSQKSKLKTRKTKGQSGIQNTLAND